MALLKTYTQRMDYFRSMVKRLKPFNPSGGSKPHFYPYKETFRGNGVSFPAFIMLPDSLFVKDEKSDNHHLMNSAGFWVLQTCAKDDLDSRQKALDECCEAGWEVLCQLDEDAKTFTSGKSISEWDPNTIAIDELPEEMLDNCVGYHFSFEYGNPKALKRNLNLWHS